MKNLFREWESYGPDGEQIAGEAEQWAKAMLTRWHAEGYGLREIAHVLFCAIATAENIVVIETMLREYTAATVPPAAQ